MLVQHPAVTETVRFTDSHPAYSVGETPLGDGFFCNRVSSVVNHKTRELGRADPGTDRHVIQG